jgi:5-methylcytosine-specific restriction endonuclease McrA
MANRKITEAEKELIRQTYIECGESLAKTAKQLIDKNINKSMIFRLIRADKGLCACGRTRAKDRKLCQNCLDIARKSHGQKRRERNAAGLCSVCSEPVANGNKSYCRKHADIDNQSVKRIRQERKAKGVCIICQEALAPTSKTHCQKHLAYHNFKSLNHRFEGNAIKALERDSFLCTICGENGTVSRIEVHHIDRNRANNAVENLCTICGNCHRALTWMLSSNNPHAVYQYLLDHYYQDLGRDFQSQDSPNSRSLQYPSPDNVASI